MIHVFTIRRDGTPMVRCDICRETATWTEPDEALAWSDQHVCPEPQVKPGDVIAFNLGTVVHACIWDGETIHHQPHCKHQGEPMKLTDEQLDAIHEAATKAPHKSWALDEWGDLRDTSTNKEILSGTNTQEGFIVDPADAVLIADMDPNTTLALVHEVKAQRAAIAEVHRICGSRADLDTDRGGCEGAWDEMVGQVLEALEAVEA